MKQNHTVEPDLFVINKPLPESDKKLLSVIIDRAKKKNVKNTVSVYS